MFIPTTCLFTAEVEKKRPRPKTKIVRDSSAQTTPVHSPVLHTQRNGQNGDYRTIVHVYDNPVRNPDIRAVYNQSQLTPIQEAKPGSDVGCIV